jgi:hypothetical protein
MAFEVMPATTVALTLRHEESGSGDFLLMLSLLGSKTSKPLPQFITAERDGYLGELADSGKP